MFCFFLCHLILGDTVTKSGKTRMRPTDVRIRLASVGRFLVWANRSEWLLINYGYT